MENTTKNESIENEFDDSGITDIEKLEEVKPESIPLDTFQKITYYNNQFSINNIIDMINDKDLDLGDTDLYSKNNIEESLFEGNIKYQRNFIWEVKTQTRFIESVILNLPIPNLIFYTKKNKTSWNVIDGKQRLTTIFLFIEGKIGLNKKVLTLTEDDLIDSEFDVLKYFEENSLDKDNYDLDKEIYYFSLKKDLQKLLKYYRLNVTTIDLDSSLEDKLKTKLEFEIFDRLNTGSVGLSLQEIRNNIISDSILQKSLKKLSRLSSFEELYYTYKEGKERFNISGNYTKRKRMYDQELILRVIYFLEEITLDKKYLINNKDELNGINSSDDLLDIEFVKKSFKFNNFASMKKNLDNVAPLIKNSKEKIEKYEKIITETFNEIYKKGGKNIFRKPGLLAFNISFFESIFIPVLYCKYYNITINLSSLETINRNVFDDTSFKEIINKGGSTKKEYILYKIILGFKFLLINQNADGSK